MYRRSASLRGSVIRSQSMGGIKMATTDHRTKNAAITACAPRRPGRITVTFSYEPHVRVSIRPGLSARCTRTSVFLPPPVVDGRPTMDFATSLKGSLAPQPDLVPADYSVLLEIGADIGV